MKAIVIGLGSMGQRRIRLMKEYIKNIDEIVGIDERYDRRSNSEEKYGIKTYSDLNDAIVHERPTIAVVCTSPLTHSKIILFCLMNNLHVFTELNLVSNDYDEIIFLARSRKLQLFLSSTLMYRKEIEYIKENVIRQDGLFNYNYHVGQYLPDWHPWENYKDFFVGKVETNGCRELLAIELPWIINIFGEVAKIQVTKSKISNLDIDYYDSYLLILEHEDGSNGSVNVDIVSRKAVRRFELYSENVYILWDGTPKGLIEYDIENKKDKKIDLYEEHVKDISYVDNIIEDAYLEELLCFIKNIKNNIDDSRHNFEKDKYILEIIDKIEEV